MLHPAQVLSLPFNDPYNNPANQPNNPDYSPWEGSPNRHNNNPNINDRDNLPAAGYHPHGHQEELFSDPSLQGRDKLLSTPKLKRPQTAISSRQFQKLQQSQQSREHFNKTKATNTLLKSAEFNANHPKNPPEDNPIVNDEEMRDRNVKESDPSLALSVVPWTGNDQTTQNNPNNPNSPVPRGGLKTGMIYSPIPKQPRRDHPSPKDYSPAPHFHSHVSNPQIVENQRPDSAVFKSLTVCLYCVSCSRVEQVYQGYHGYSG